LIGGTGVGALLAAEGGKVVHIPTRYGTARGRAVEIAGRSAILLSRHSTGHSVPPHKVNYPAIALAMKQIGVKFCLATAATGSLTSSRPVGSLVACTDFIDMSSRNVTLFDREVVHTPFGQAFGKTAHAALVEGAAKSGVNIVPSGVYIGVNGPRFETPHEVRMLARIADVVGMTAATEAIMMKEAGVEYGLLAIVTNLAEGLGGMVDHDLVGNVMVDWGPKAVAILKAAVEALPR
jgi:5'-methylthioadenosine phosphorylase